MKVPAAELISKVGKYLKDQNITIEQLNQELAVAKGDDPKFNEIRTDLEGDNQGAVQFIKTNSQAILAARQALETENQAATPISGGNIPIPKIGKDIRIDLPSGVATFDVNVGDKFGKFEVKSFTYEGSIKKSFIVTAADLIDGDTFEVAAKDNAGKDLRVKYTLKASTAITDVNIPVLEKDKEGCEITLPQGVELVLDATNKATSGKLEITK